MRRLLARACLGLLASTVNAQEYDIPDDWTPPPPPEYEVFCADEEKVSNPIISYRISPSCTLTDIQDVGEYQYGTEQVKSEVRNLSTSEMIRRFTGGSFTYYREVRIELHRARENPAALICTTEMMGDKVIDARILREPPPGTRRSAPLEQAVIVENNQLPNLGVFTYTSSVTYSTNNCPE